MKKFYEITLFILIFGFLALTISNLFLKDDKKMQDYNNKMHDFHSKTTTFGYGLGN